MAAGGDEKRSDGMCRKGVKPVGGDVGDDDDEVVMMMVRSRPRR